MVGVLLWIILGMGYILAVIEVIANTYRSSSGPVKKVWEGYKNTVAMAESFPDRVLEK